MVKNDEGNIRKFWRRSVCDTKNLQPWPSFLTLAKVGHVGLCVVHEKVSRRKNVRIFLPVNQGRSSHYGSIFSADFFIIDRKNTFIEKKAVTLVLNKGPLICPLWKLKVLPRETKQNEMVIIPTQFRLDFFVSTFLPVLFCLSPPHGMDVVFGMEW